LPPEVEGEYHAVHDNLVVGVQHLGPSIDEGAYLPDCIDGPDLPCY
jgi:hypothetical protein